MDRLNLKNSNEVEDKKQYRAEITNRFTALATLDAEVNISNVWGKLLERISKCLPKRG
jgi:hypothetical protein